MFKRTKSTQVDMFKNPGLHYSESKLKILNDATAWHNVFYQQVYRRIDETVFKPLYCLDNGRGCASVKTLVAMMILKEGQGWSDKQLFSECKFNTLIMAALGMHNADEDIPAASTYYDFRSKLLAYYETEGIDLMDKAFENVTIEQMEDFGVNGTKIRMDSKLINSNITRSSRLALILGVVRKFIKNNKLNELVKAGLSSDQYAFLVKLQSEKVSKICYGLNKAEEKILLVELGSTINVLLNSYNKAATDYAILERLFSEQYEVNNAKDEDRSSEKRADETAAKTSSEAIDKVADGQSAKPPNPASEGQRGDSASKPKDKKASQPATGQPKETSQRAIQPKAGKNISASSIQSAHDTQAAHRSKGQGIFKQQKDGYHNNITETCDEADELNLISKVITKPADVCESEFMIPSIEKTEEMLQSAHQKNEDKAEPIIQQNITDGGFDSKDNRIYMAEDDTPEWILAKTKGGKPAFTMYYTDDNVLQICDITTDKPLQTSRSRNGKKVVVHQADGSKRYFTDEQIIQYILRQQYTGSIDEVSKGLRANSESTIHQVFHRLGKRDKMKYRGLLKCHMYVLCRAFWVNCSRIGNTLAKKQAKAAQNALILWIWLMGRWGKLYIANVLIQSRCIKKHCGILG